ncbi:hypothetical protein SELMODRAFT_90222 [Selaginella moellendorffii]|uniref:Pentacotripeptide-repeat region of PRORP domain-containing protein n=1 Tax=Selaginella moellendorffii TaxID=88036 RepID=D8RCX4_SELML|nr:hypothetical protein SELMODRAFT_90222 [Selaginella moellendorffii]
MWWKWGQWSIRRRRPRFARLHSSHAEAPSTNQTDHFEETKQIYTAKLRDCTNSRSLPQARRLHAEISSIGLIRDHFVANLVIHMYGRCGDIASAREIFDSMPRRNRFSWSIMIGAYAQTGHGRDALELFQRMGREGVRPSSRDVIAWNAIIAANAQLGHGKEALELLQRMDLEGVRPNQVSFVSALDGCASIGALAEGRSIHARVRASRSLASTTLGNTLIHMYGKCGSLAGARVAFEEMGGAAAPRDAVSWAALVAAYARHGRSRAAREVFERMAWEGVQPSGVAFVSILAACSHGGLLLPSRSYFLAMSGDHGIAPSMEHYGCVIDLLGRLGMMEELMDLIAAMPFEPGGIEWRNVLGACRTQSDVENGSDAAEIARELEPEHAAAYVMLFGLYSTEEP